MAIELDSLGYRGTYVYSAPIVKQNEDSSLLVITSPYGDPSYVDQALSEMINEFSNQAQDPDSTSPYPKLTCYDDHANALFTSIQFLNDFIYSNFNREKIVTGCDLVCILRNKDTLYFCQVGWPMIALRSAESLVPLGTEYCFHPHDPNESPYLPSNLIGLYSSSPIKIQSINLKANEEIVLLKSNISIDQLNQLAKTDLEEMAQKLIALHPDQGFWLGLATLGAASS